MNKIQSAVNTDIPNSEYAWILSIHIDEDTLSPKRSHILPEVNIVHFFFKSVTVEAVVVWWSE